MGLDLRVYSNIQKIETKFDEDGDIESDYSFQAFVICEEWNDRIKNLENEAYYKGDCEEHLGYAYSGHGWFRQKLAELIGYSGERVWHGLDDKKIPFAYLFDFADNEGCFDWEISEKLYQDFKEFEEKALSNEDKYFVNRYKEWMNLVDIGRNKGVIVFS